MKNAWKDNHHVNLRIVDFRWDLLSSLHTYKMIKFLQISVYCFIWSGKKSIFIVEKKQKKKVWFPIVAIATTYLGINPKKFNKIIIQY